jgi:regulator of sigma E protease
VMNILLAVVVLAIVLVQGAEMPAYLDQPATIARVAAGSAAERGGMRAGDRILTVDGERTDTWDEAEIAVKLRPNRAIPVTIERDGRTLALNVQSTSEGRWEAGAIGVTPTMRPMAKGLERGDPADKAGMKPGDVVVAVNGVRMSSSEDLTTAIRSNAEKPIDMLVSRNGVEQHLQVTPVLKEDRGWIGITIVAESKSFKPGPLEALRMSVVQNATSGVMIFKILGGLFTGSTSVRQLQGPVGIAQLSGESAQAGFVQLLALMAVISLNLGLLNLMPVPVLDGGHILIMALEGVARRDFSMAVKEKMLLAGFVVLMMLMVTVIYNDLTRINWIERLMPWRN